MASITFTPSGSLVTFGLNAATPQQFAMPAVDSGNTDIQIIIPQGGNSNVWLSFLPSPVWFAYNFNPCAGQGSMFVANGGQTLLTANPTTLAQAARSSLVMNVQGGAFATATSFFACSPGFGGYATIQRGTITVNLP